MIYSSSHIKLKSPTSVSDNVVETILDWLNEARAKFIKTLYKFSRRYSRGDFRVIIFPSEISSLTKPRKNISKVMHTSRVTLFTQLVYNKLIKALYQCMQLNNKLDFIE